jgi:ADP-ribose pyrophosphatase
LPFGIKKMKDKNSKPHQLETVTSRFSYDDVKLQKQQPLYHGFFKVNSYQLRHALYCGGQSNVIKRELFERGDAVAVLPYDPTTDEVILVEQFRVGAYAAGIRDAKNNIPIQSPWLIECIAGMIDKGRDAQSVAIAEAKEEAGIELNELKQVMQYYSSPGGMSERIHLFVATTDASKANGVHGLDVEGEDILVLRVKLAQACEWVRNGKINNATTVIALQWLQLNKADWLTAIT